MMIITALTAASAVVASAPETGYCGISPARTGNPDRTPCLAVPACSAGVGVISSFRVSTAPGLLPALQNTRLEVCWSAAGITVRTNATDGDVFNRCAKCQCSNFAQGDALEVIGFGRIVAPEIVRHRIC